MQHIQLIETLKWINETIPKVAKETILGDDKTTDAEESDKPKLSPERLLPATHQLARIQPMIHRHPFAPRVLSAFGLDALLSDVFDVYVLNPEAGKPTLLQDLRRAWSCLKHCIVPLESLTVPEQIRNVSELDEVLTVEFRGTDLGTPTITEIEKVLRSFESVYDTVVHLRGLDATDKLKIVYASMGSDVRFDFTGLGDPIRAVKDFFLEAWQTFRHRKADAFLGKTKAGFEGIALIREIDEATKSGALSSEDGNQAKAAVINGFHTVFANGATIREIERNESVDNHKLLSEYRQKLLPAPPESVKKKSSGRRTKVKVKKSK